MQNKEKIEALKVSKIEKYFEKITNASITTTLVHLVIWTLIMIVIFFAAGKVLNEIKVDVDPINKIIKALYLIAAASVLTILNTFICIITIFPLESMIFENKLQKVGFVNSIGVCPYLLDKKLINKVIEYKFAANGIELSRWNDEQEKVEQALNKTITSLKYQNGKKYVLVKCVKPEDDLPGKVMLNTDELPQDKNTYLLGKGVVENITIDLHTFPHLAIAGSTGSGKTWLLKFVLMQALAKKEEVVIADFKGGVDFPPLWKEKCTMCTEEKDTLDQLDKIVKELNNRKLMLSESGCLNVDEYNKRFNKGLKRIIFACDEVAELLDTTAASKERKEILKRIESDLTTIARLGRAFNINLVLATQRPDADILKGQIKNNIDYRVAGRCDETLARVIGITDAHNLVPKDIPGRFVNYEEKMFQGYIFDETLLLN